MRAWGRHAPEIEALVGGGDLQHLLHGAHRVRVTAVDAKRSYLEYTTPHSQLGVEHRNLDEIRRNFVDLTKNDA